MMEERRQLTSVKRLLLIIPKQRISNSEHDTGAGTRRTSPLATTREQGIFRGMCFGETAPREGRISQHTNGVLNYPRKSCKWYMPWHSVLDVVDEGLPPLDVYNITEVKEIQEILKENEKLLELFEAICKLANKHLETEDRTF